MIIILQEMLDECEQHFTGRLICLGSHTSKLRRMIIDKNEPLCGSAFHTMVIPPTSPSSICKLLREVCIFIMLG